MQPPIWKKNVNVSGFAERNRIAIEDENRRLREEERTSLRTQGGSEPMGVPKMKSGIGTVQFDLGGGVWDQRDAEELADDPIYGGVAHEALWKRDMKSARDEADSIGLELSNPSRKRLSKSERDEMLAVGSQLQETDPQHKDLKAKLIADDEMTAMEQKQWDAKKRVQELGSMGPKGYQEYRQKQKLQSVSQASQSIAQQEAEIQAKDAEGVSGRDLQAHQTAKQSVIAQKQDIQQQAQSMVVPDKRVTGTTTNGVFQEANPSSRAVKDESNQRAAAIKILGVSSQSKAIAGKEEGIYQKGKDFLNEIFGNSKDSASIGALLKNKSLKEAIVSAENDISAPSRLTGGTGTDMGGAAMAEAERKETAKKNLPKLKELQESLGDDADRIISDAAKEYAWTAKGDDLARTISDGSIVINPGQVFGDISKVQDAIKNASSDPSVQKAGLDRLVRMRESMAETLEEKLYTADVDFKAFADNWQGDKVSMIDQWRKNMNDRGKIEKFADAAINGVYSGLLGIAETGLDVTAGAAALVGADGVAGSVGKNANLLAKGIEGRGEAAQNRGLTGAYGVTGDIANTVTQMAPMLVGGAYAQGMESIVAANLTRGAAVYGTAFAQGAGSKYQDAVALEEEKKGRTLTEQEIADVLGRKETQVAAFSNGFQTAILSKLLPGGSEKIALKGAAREMTVLDFLSKGGRAAIRDAGLKAELKQIGKTMLFDAGDEALEEGINQALDAVISTAALGKDMKLGDVIEESIKASLMGGVVGGVMPQARFSKAEKTAAAMAAQGQAAPTTEEQRKVEEVAGADADVDQQVHHTNALREIATAGDPEVTARATGTLKLARGAALVELDKEERTTLGINEDGSPISPDIEPLVQMMGNRPIILNAAIAELESIAPSAKKLGIMTEGEARTKFSKQPFTVTSKSGAVIQVDAKDAAEAEKIGAQQFTLGDGVETVTLAATGGSGRGTANPPASTPTGTKTAQPVADQTPVDQTVQKLRARLGELVNVTNDPNVRVHAVPDLIEINPEALKAEAAANGLNEAQAAKWISDIVDEEVRHLAQHSAASDLYEQSGDKREFKEWRDEHYANVWNTEFVATGKDAIVRKLYGDKLDSMPEWKRAMEGIRMMWQRKENGNPTETAKLWTKLSAAMIEELKAVLRQLRAMVKNLTPEMKRELALLQSKLKEIENEQNNQGPAKEQSKPQASVPVQSVPVGETAKPSATPGVSTGANAAPAAPKAEAENVAFAKGDIVTGVSVNGATDLQGKTFTGIIVNTSNDHAIVNIGNGKAIKMAFASMQKAKGQKTSQSAPQVTEAPSAITEKPATEKDNLSATLTFPSRTAAQRFATAWGRHSTRGHDISASDKGGATRVTVYGVSDTNREWINSYVEAAQTDTPQQDNLNDSPPETHTFYTPNPDAKVIAHGTVKIVSAAELERMVLSDVSENQARLRTGQNANSEAQVAKIAANPKPNLLLGIDSTVSEGAPTVYDGEVLAGNGRSIGIIAAYKGGKADAYKQAAIAKAKQIGVAFDEGITDPVLIRFVTRFENGTAQDFADQSNSQGMLGLSAVELAKIDAQVLGDFAAVETTASGDFTAATIRDIAAAFDRDGRNKVTRETNGQPSVKQVSDRIRNAALAGLFGKAGKPMNELLGVMESDEGARLMSIIAANASRLMAMDQDLSLSIELTDALIEVQSGLRAVAAGAFKSLREWQANRDAELIGRTNISDGGLWLADKMVEAQKKPSVLKDLLVEYLSLAETEQKQRNEANQSDDIFGEQRSSKSTFSDLIALESGRKRIESQASNIASQASDPQTPSAELSGLLEQLDDLEQELSPSSFTLESVTDDQLKDEGNKADQKAKFDELKDRRLTGGAGDLTADMFGSTEGETPLFNDRRDVPKVTFTDTEKFAADDFDSLFVSDLSSDNPAGYTPKARYTPKSNYGAFELRESKTRPTFSRSSTTSVYYPDGHEVKSNTKAPSQIPTGGREPWNRIRGINRRAFVSLLYKAAKNDVRGISSDDTPFIRALMRSDGADQKGGIESFWQWFLDAINHKDFPFDGDYVFDVAESIFDAGTMQIEKVNQGYDYAEISPDGTVLAWDKKERTFKFGKKPTKEQVAEAKSYSENNGMALYASDISPTYTANFPPEKLGGMINAAAKFIADGINTPEGMAAALTKIEQAKGQPGALRKYSEAFWSAFRMVDTTLPKEVDWAKVYAGNSQQNNDTTSNDEPSSSNLESNSTDANLDQQGGESGIQPQSGSTSRDGKSVVSGGGRGKNTASNNQRTNDNSPIPNGSGSNQQSSPAPSEPISNSPVTPNSDGSRIPDESGVEPYGRGDNDAHDGTIQTDSSGAMDTSRRAIGDVKRSAPSLKVEQAEDVVFVETRLIEKGETGVLLTNGTGTGKTFSGLGVIKRELERGSRHIAIIAPSDKVVSDWVKTAKQFFGIDDIVQLDGIQDNGGNNRIIVTTYSNFGQNNELVKRPWTMVVTDESHYLSQAKDGTSTLAQRTFKGLTWHYKDGVRNRLSMEMAEEYAEISALNEKLNGNNRIINGDDTMDQMRVALQEENDGLETKLSDLRAKIAARESVLKEQAKGMAKASRPKGLFLSATPFAYHFSLDYAEGYLFEHGEDPQSSRYNTPSARSKFFMDKLGYRMRYGKLTQPENAAATGILERMFAEKLKRDGAMRGRMLSVPFDYSREFVLAESMIGSKIDEIFDVIMQNDTYAPLRNVLEIGDYLSRRYLLEGLKSIEVVKRVRDHLALERKVVVFHDYKKGGATNPLRLNSADPVAKEAYEKLRDEVKGFDQIVKSLDNLRSPILLFRATFPDAGIFNGDVPRAERRSIIDNFNASGSKMNVILAQRASAKEGISMHDTDGKHQRVFIDLGIPGRPTDAIQSEGRIIRLGMQSNGIIEYLTTGTNFERYTFAQTIATRASTAENLAMGENARALLQAFSTGYNDASPVQPSEKQGTGGKAIDLARESGDPFENAVALYFTNQKKTSKNKAQEGIDYFATPEPLGFKMVEWAGIRAGDRVLEPSGGHGAIARFFPDSTTRHAVEPSYELAGRLALNAPDTRIHQMPFEDYEVMNKFDDVVMNPPFGNAGKTAMEHLEKAVKHLKNGGRVVALIPMGISMEKRFNKWYEDVQGVFLTAEILLPSVTFERAGTSVSARIVVLDKVDAERAPQQVRRDLTDAKTVRELFDKIKDSSIPPRPEPVEEKTPSQKLASLLQGGRDAKLPDVTTTTTDFSPMEFNHSKTGKPIFVAKINRKLDKPEYDNALSRAKANGGYYSAFNRDGAIPGFHFKTSEDRDGFITPTDSLYASDLPNRARAEMDEGAIKETMAQQKEFGNVVKPPNRASMGDEKTRQVVDVFDIDFEQRREKESHDQWVKQGTKKAATGRKDLIENALMNAYGEVGAVPMQPEDMIGTQIVIEQMVQEAGNNFDKLIEAGTIIQAYRKVRGDIARVLASGWDRLMPPDERNRRYLANAILTLPPIIERDISKRGYSPEKTRELIQDALRKRLNEIEKALKEYGVTINEVLGKQVYLSLNKKNIVKDIMSTSTKDEQLAIRMHQQATDVQKIAKATHMTVAEVQELITKTYNEALERMKVKARGGATLESLQTSALSEAEIEAEARRMVEIGLGISPTAHTTATRMMKRKAIKVTTEPQQVNWARPEFTSGLLDFTFDTKDLADIKQTAQALIDATAAKAKVESITDPKQRAKADALLAKLEAILAKYGTNISEVVESGKPLESYRFDITDRVHVHIVANAIRSVDADWIDKGTEYAYFSMLSGLQTAAVNASSIMHGVMDATIGRGFEMLTNAFLSRPENATLGEVKYMVKAMGPILSRAKSNFLASFGAEAPFFEQDILGVPPDLEKILEGHGMYHRTAISGQKGRLLRIPTRLLLATDEFVKTINAMAEVGAMAYRLCRAANLTPDTPAFNEKIKELVNVPGSLAWQLAAKKAYQRTFTNALPGETDPVTGKERLPRTAGEFVGAAVGGMQRVINKDYGSMEAKLAQTLLRLTFIPFVKIPYNITALALTYTPLSLIEIAQLYARNRKPKNKMAQAEVVERLSRVMLGGVIMTMLLGMGEGDDDDLEKALLVTGSRPYNDTKKGVREAGQRLGVDAYSISWPMGKGKRGVFHYGRIDPLATILATTIDTLKELKQSSQGKQAQGEAMGSILNGFANQLSDKTFLKGFGDFMKMAQGETDMSRFTADKIGMLVPNMIKQPLRESDPSFRDKGNSFGEELTYALFPYGQKEAKVNIYGEESKKLGSPLTRWFDFTDAGAAETKPLDEMLWRYQQKFPNGETLPSDASPTYSVNGKQQKMTENQAAMYRKQAGQVFTARLPRLTLNYNNPTDADIKSVQKLVDESRDIAKKILTHKPDWK